MNLLSKLRTSGIKHKHHEIKNKTKDGWKSKNKSMKKKIEIKDQSQAYQIVTLSKN